MKINKHRTIEWTSTNKMWRNCRIPRQRYDLMVWHVFCSYAQFDRNESHNRRCLWYAKFRTTKVAWNEWWFWDEFGNLVCNLSIWLIAMYGWSTIIVTSSYKPKSNQHISMYEPYSLTLWYWVSWFFPRHQMDWKVTVHAYVSKWTMHVGMRLCDR